MGGGCGRGGRGPNGAENTKPVRGRQTGRGGPLAFWLGDLGPMLRARRAPPTRRAVVMQGVMVEGASHEVRRLTEIMAIRQFLLLSG